MPPQDQTPMKEADLEPMSRNLKEGDHYIVHHGEGLTSVDFDDHVNLAEKDGAGRLDPVGSDPGEHGRRPRSPLAEVATPGGSRCSGDRRSPTTSTARPTDLKGHIVEEGEAEVIGARGDAVGVSMTGLGNDYFKTGDATSSFTGARRWKERAAAMAGKGYDYNFWSRREGRGGRRRQKERAAVLMRQWWCMRKMASCIRTPQQKSEEVDDNGSRGSRRRRRVVVDKR
ncbi:hypothetical protein B296_00008334 [Ensete ventricosum]|uniref:Uncharacterized protein n=1 Tax=Ensete ventricosum TaxID=4639 RepID=A0A426YNB7_ENSVE|nr:hypothetical protein B296_00008334 [Ensete ventricosum]